MQAVGRRPQTAPDLWSRVPGAGAREERRGGLRWYPECTLREVYPHCPVPTGAKQRSHNLMLITPYTTHCRADRYAASPRNKKISNSLPGPRPKVQRSHTRERETGRNSPPSSASRSVAGSCSHSRRLSKWVLRRGSPGRLWRPCPSRPSELLGHTNQPLTPPPPFLTHSTHQPTHP